MNAQPERLLDRTGRRLLHLLQEKARLSFSELGRRVGLTAPAVAERVHRLEDAGIISGYHAQVKPDKIGLPIIAFVRLSTLAEHYPRVIALAQRAPEVLECHHVSGSDSFVLRVAVASVGHLETLIGRFSPYGQTSTAIVLSSPVAYKPLEVETVFASPNADTLKI